MTREETKKIVMVMVSTYPNWKPNNLSATVDAWSIMLDEQSYEEVAIALKTYANTDTSGFAPSVGQLTSIIRNIKDKGDGTEELTENDAWVLVFKAIKRSSWYSEEEFEKLPPTVRKAVGNPMVLKEWAQTENLNLSVESSNFKRNYNTLAAREREMKALPQSTMSYIEERRKKAEMLGTVEHIEDPVDLNKKMLEMFSIDDIV